MPGHSFIEIVLHLDKYLGDVIAAYQGWTYAILALCIFIETGLVVCPFLPGDTLLLAAGLFAGPAKGQLHITLLCFVLVTASILGDNTNFWIGRLIGKRLFKNPNSKVFNPAHLDKAREFYHKHGAKAIIIGKYLAIVRTVVPFVAGMEAMPYARFFPLSVISGVCWVLSCTLAGYFLGGIPIVRDNFEKVILGVLLLTALVIILEAWRHKRGERRAVRDKLAPTEPS
ncbi:MAG: VTT domain-containing protein [Armatimonadetes bacterium]|nr:VTT domain-containing protein [Armatimonadota bacterium]